MMQLVSLPIVVNIGVVYDTFGRKMPLIIAWVLAIISFMIFPYTHNKYVFYLLNILMVPLNCTLTLPFVPDLIEEKS